MDSDIILKLRVKGGTLSSHTIIISFGEDKSSNSLWCLLFYRLPCTVTAAAEAASWFVYNRQTSPVPEMWIH